MTYLGGYIGLFSQTGDVLKNLGLGRKEIFSWKYRALVTKN